MAGVADWAARLLMEVENTFKYGEALGLTHNDIRAVIIKWERWAKFTGKAMPWYKVRAELLQVSAERKAES